MRALKFILVVGLLIGAAGLNFLAAFQLSNALFLLPTVALLSIATLLYHRKLWFTLFFFLIFFDMRGELAAIPIYLWEIHLFAVVPILFLRARQPGLNRIEVALFIVFGVAVLSALMNASYLQGLKSSVRWLEYLALYRVTRIASGSMFDSGQPTTMTRLLAAPLLALALFTTVQATVIKSDWTRILDGRVGALILGPTESKVRTTRNNFGYTGDKEDAFRAPGFYISPVDLAGVLVISVATLYLTGTGGLLTNGVIFFGVIALTLSMGRAALLYGCVGVVVATLIYQRRASTLVSLLAALLVGAATVVAYAPARDRLLALTETEQNSEVERTLIWQTGLNIWKTSPVYGKGGGSMAEQFTDNVSVDWLAGKQASTHSTYIGTLAELGILGLVAWFYFLWTLRGEIVHEYHSSQTKSLLCFCLIFFILMGVSSDTYTAGNPYFLLVLVLFGLHSHNFTGALTGPVPLTKVISPWPRNVAQLVP